MKRLLLAVLLTVMLTVIVSGASQQDLILNDYKTGITLFKESGDYNEALKSFLNFMRHSENDAEQYGQELMITYCYVGTIYGSYGDYPKAVSYFREGLSLSEKENDLRFRRAFVNNITNCLIELKRFDEAEQMLGTLKVLPDTTGHTMFEYHLSKGNIAREKGDMTAARTEYDMARIIAETNRYEPYELACLMSNIASTFSYRMAPDSQEFYLRIAHKLALNQSMSEPKITTARDLMRLYARTGRMDSTVVWQERYFLLSDSLMPVEDYTFIRSTHDIETLESKGKQIEGLSSTVLWQRWVIVLCIVAVIIVSALLTVIYRQKQRITVAYRVLFDKDKREIVSLTDSSHVSNTTPENKCAGDGITLNPEEENFDTQSDEADNVLYDEIVRAMNSTNAWLNPDFGLAQLTSLVKSNTAYVSRVIGKVTGDNVKSFINSYRVTEAKKRMLINGPKGQMTLQAIAESVGFGSQVSFNRAFKRIAGMTPSAYLAMARKDEQHLND